MHVLLIVHQEDTGPGVFLDSLVALGAQAVTWEPASGAPAPAAPEEFDAVISLGGAVHPVQDAGFPWLTAEKRLLAQGLEQQVPMFGVCLGSQLIAAAAGAATSRASAPEIGWYEVRRELAAEADPVFSVLPERFDALQWHSYESSLPAGATALASSDICLQGYRIGDRVWGIQFHAEVTGEDFQHWLDTYDTDPDAVRIGLDATAVAAATRERIGAWNELGRGLCERFLKAASGL